MFVSVKGKVVLILGGSSGIGKALANRFCKEGAAVVATYFSTKTNEVAEMLEDNFRYCDIRHPSELNSVCEYIMKLIAFVGMDGVGKTGILNSIYSRKQIFLALPFSSYLSAVKQAPAYIFD